MKIITWNVNGIRACITKGFLDFFKEVDADIFCIQESKMQEGQIELDLLGYQQFWHSAVKKGYSGTAVFTKIPPISVARDFPSDITNPVPDEGRVLTLEYKDFYLVNAYVPNAQRELTRLKLRIEWENALREYLTQLPKPVIYCGDLNVAHNEIDLRYPVANKGNAGFTKEERAAMTNLLNAGFIDVFRTLFPENKEYTWWSYMQSARSKDIGWRIDYFIISNSLFEHTKDCKIHKLIMGSDHCPVELTIF